MYVCQPPAKCVVYEALDPRADDFVRTKILLHDGLKAGEIMDDLVAETMAHASF